MSCVAVKVLPPSSTFFFCLSSSCVSQEWSFSARFSVALEDMRVSGCICMEEVGMVWHGIAWYGTVRFGVEGKATCGMHGVD